MYKFFFALFFSSLLILAAKAQAPDTVGKKSSVAKSLQEKRDSVKEHPIVPRVKEKVWHPDSNHSPHKAVMHSLMIPGWGQAYNKQYWLIPPIYVGLGLLVRSYITNKNDYNAFLAVAKYREQGIAPGPNDAHYADYVNYAPFSTAAIDDAVTASNRNTEICIFSFAAVWGIQIIQAYVEAKFQHSYTMDNNLTLKVSPAFMNNQPVYASNFNPSYIPGLKLTFTLK